MDVSIIYEDEAVLVCKKPAGIAVQTKRLGQADMESLLKNYRVSKGEPPYIGVVHRLDQPVEGIMVFAKTKEASVGLCRQIAEGLADKYYYALVEGIPEKRKGKLEDYLRRDGKSNTSSIVEKGTKDAKRAALSYEVIETGKTCSILRICLETGRHHQIRVQLANAGWPIAGDQKYNFKENMRPWGRALALCSCKIGFKHPVTHRKMEFEIDKPFTLS